MRLLDQHAVSIQEDRTVMFHPNIPFGKISISAS